MDPQRLVIEPFVSPLAVRFRCRHPNNSVNASGRWSQLSSSTSNAPAALPQSFAGLGIDSARQSMSGSTQYAELPVPTRGDALGATLGYLFVLIFVLVAAGNLVYLRRIPIVATLASVGWLFLVFWVVVANVCEEGGVRQYVINRMGIYASHQFVRAEPSENAISISIGYLLFRQPLNYLKIPTSAVSSIQWSSGQGTAMAGRDMNDWSVALWYNHPNGPRRKTFPGVRDEEIFLIGPSGQKEKVEAFGKQLVAFLTRIGVEITVGRDDCEFNTPSRCMASEQSGQREPPITRVVKS